MPKQQRGIKVICEEGEKSLPSNLWSDTLPLIIAQSLHRVMEFSYTNTVHEQTYQGTWTELSLILRIQTQHVPFIIKSTLENFMAQLIFSAGRRMQESIC